MGIFSRLFQNKKSEEKKVVIKTPSKPKIAVDICNTIADVNAVLREEGFDTSFYGSVPEEYFDKNLWVYSKAEPMEYAAKALEELSKYYEIVYMTARSEKASLVTDVWLSVNKFPYGEVIYTNDKVAECKRLGISVAIDDSVKEIYSYLGADIDCIVVEQPYNKGWYDGFSWSQLLLEARTFWQVGGDYYGLFRSVRNV